MQAQTYSRPLLVLKSAVFWIWMVINTLIMGVPVVLFGLFSVKLSYYFAQIWLKLNLHGLRLICNVSWKIDGLENIPEHACIMLSKHQSTWEAYFLPTLLRQPVYVAKRSLVLIPIFGWTLALLRFILIDRKSGGSAVSQMVEQAKDRLAHGRSVIVFPEGTRRPVGAEPDYRIGAAVVAEKTGADVVPVAVNAGEFWPRMGFIKWPGEITVSIGPVITTEGKKAAEILAETQAWIESRMSEITVLNRFPY